MGIFFPRKVCGLWVRRRGASQVSWQARLAPASRCRSPHTAHSSVHGKQHTAHSTPHSSHTAQNTLHSLHTAQNTLQSSHTGQNTPHGTKYTAQLSGKHRLSHSAPVAASSLRRTQPRMIKTLEKHENMNNFGLEEAKSDTL